MAEKSTMAPLDTTLDGIDEEAIDAFLAREDDLSGQLPARSDAWSDADESEASLDQLTGMARERSLATPLKVAAASSEEKPEAVGEEQPARPTVADARSSPPKVVIPKGALRIAVTKDRMRARLKIRPTKAGDLTYAAALAGLKKGGIVDGISEDAVIELVEEAKGSSSAEVCAVVAEGASPVPGRNAAVTYPALEGDDGGSKAARLVATTQRLGQVLEGGDWGQIDAQCAGLPQVKAGEVAAELRSAVPGSPGRDVCGRELPMEAVAEDLPSPGPGVEAREEGAQFVATTFGYLCSDGESVWLESPVRIDPDGLRVEVLALMPCNGPLSTEQVLARMEEQGVVDLPEAKALTAQLDVEEPGAVTACEASPPTEGSDAEVNLQVATGDKAGKLREDGTIDLKERSFATNVVREAYLAVKRLAVEGAAGTNVIGEAIPPRPVQDVPLNPGEAVEVVEKAGELRFYSTREGCVYLEDGVLSVRPEVQVSGDVDYDSGNIECRGDVTVKGAVRGGFAVKATGDVLIGEGVENGARVQAGGSIVVSKGISGENTRVSAGEAIATQFVQGAALQCGADVEVGSYAYNAVLRSGGTITVYGKGERGGVVGGRMVGRDGIVASQAGSEFGAATQLVAGVDESAIRSQQRVEQGLQFCQTTAAKIAKALKVDPAAEDQDIRKAARQVPKARRPKARELGGKLRKLQETSARLEGERERLQSQAEELARSGRIRVDGVTFHKVELFIGKAHRRVKETLKGTVYYLSEEDQIEARPVQAGEG